MLRAAVGPHADDAPRPGAERDQPMREPITLLVEIAEAERRVLVMDRRSVGRAVNLSLDERVQERRALVGDSVVVPVDEQTPVLRLVEQRQLGDATVRRLRHAAQERLVVTDHARDRRGLEEVGAVLDAPDDAAVALVQLEGEVKLRGVRVDLELAHVPARGRGCDLGLQDDHRLEGDPAVGRGAHGRVSRDELERDVLEREGFAAGLPDGAQHVEERAVGGEGGAEQDRVEEDADLALHAGHAPGRQRGADGDVGLPRVAVEERLERRDERREERDALAAREIAEARSQIVRQREALPGAGERPPRPRAPVRG